MPLPALLIPAVGSSLLQSSGLWPSKLIAVKIAEISMFLVALCLAVPGSLALFNKKASIEKDSLEGHF